MNKEIIVAGCIVELVGLILFPFLLSQLEASVILVILLVPILFIIVGLIIPNQKIEQEKN